MLRVLQIGMTDNWGGIESYLINYYRNIDRNKIQFDFINIYDKKLYFQDEIEKFGGKVYNVHSYYKNPKKYIEDVANIIKKNNYEIVHCNMNSAVFLYPLKAAKKGGAKVIISHAHNASSDKGILKAFLHNINKNFISKYANVFFSCSDKAGKWFFNEKIRTSSNYYIVNNAIDTEKYEFSELVRAKKRKELNINEDCFVIGHVGRFCKQKNHDFILAVFKKIKEDNKNNIKLVLVGVGPLEEKIKDQAKKMGFYSDVIFLGQRNDVNELMSIFDLFFLPSLYEGLPLVGIEAQASGLKCVLSSEITKELNILSSINKYISLNDDLKKWKDEIIKVNHFDRKDAATIIKNKGYDIRINAKRLLEIYEKERGSNDE
ncbi:MAG: glycosyltransferase family 1 protein [Bacilli bacterium]|nr:glycosyltransferase family 1 protein [Bacilli bacterium]